MRTATRRYLQAAVLVFLSGAVSASPMGGGVQDRVSDDVVATFSAPHAAGAKLRVAGFPIDGRKETLLLEEFDVLAPNAEVIVWGADGKSTRVKPSPLRQYRGTIAGDPRSLVYLSSGSQFSGLVLRGGRKFFVTSRVGRQGSQREVFVDEVSLLDEMDVLGNGYSCDLEERMIVPNRTMVPESLAFGAGPRDETALISPTATSTYNLVISTDAALYARLGSTVPGVDTYVRNLLGAASTIYQRDLDVDLKIVALDIRTTTDPWVINPGATGLWTTGGVTASTTYSTLHALAEYGDYWHNSPPTAVRKSAAMLLSGQTQTAGVAWTDIACQGEFLCTAGYGSPFADHYGGAYAYCGGVAGTGDTGIPNVNTSVGSSNYWSLLQVAHELGHIVQSPHTHCTILTAPRQALYGRTYVDQCYASEGGCYSGGTGVPAEKGTIMSYCHIPGGGTQTRWMFGQAGEASEQILENMRNVADVRDQWGGLVGIVPKTPALSVISLSNPVMTAGSSGTASITAQAGFEYVWTVTNGAINSGQSTNSINFTANTNPVTIRVTVTNSSGCGATDTASVTVNGASVAAPTNVVATAAIATSIGVTWTASAGAVSYQVFRRTGAVWGQIGTSVTTGYTDNTATANTAYLYRVRAVDAGTNVSADSGYDLATAIVFTDPALSSSVAVKALHVSELRTAVNAVRALATLTAVSFTDPALSSSVTVKSAHVSQLRTGLDEARAALSMSTLAYTDAAPTGVIIKAVHLTELRSGVR